MIVQAPPKELRYYVTINGKPVYSTDQPVTSIDDDYKIDLDFINVIDKSEEKLGVIDQEYLDKLQCFPRPERPKFIFEDDEPPEPEWRFEDSIFYGYQPDTDSLLRK